MTATDPITRETSRGFYVFVELPPNTVRRKPKLLRYPATGCAALTGRQALTLMETLASRGRSVQAWTTSPDPEGDTLTLDEMREAVL